MFTKKTRTQSRQLTRVLVFKLSGTSWRRELTFNQFRRVRDPPRFFVTQKYNNIMTDQNEKVLGSVSV